MANRAVRWSKPCGFMLYTIRAFSIGVSWINGLLEKEEGFSEKQARHIVYFFSCFQQIFVSRIVFESDDRSTITSNCLEMIKSWIQKKNHYELNYLRQNRSFKKKKKCNIPEDLACKTNSFSLQFLNDLVISEKSTWSTNWFLNFSGCNFRSEWNAYDTCASIPDKNN